MMVATQPNGQKQFERQAKCEASKWAHGENDRLMEWPSLRHQRSSSLASTFRRPFCRDHRPLPFVAANGGRWISRPDFRLRIMPLTEHRSIRLIRRRLKSSRRRPGVDSGQKLRASWQQTNERKRDAIDPIWEPTPCHVLLSDCQDD